MSFRRVLDEAELWVGEMRQLRIDGVSVLLLRTDAGVFAYEDRCPHLGVPLSEGSLEGARLTCRAHHFSYAADSGAGINPKSVCLKAFSVRLSSGGIWVDLHARESEEHRPA